MFKSKVLPQPEFFVVSARLVQPATTSFYVKLEQTLASFGFSDKVRQLCASAYSTSGRGRPGIDPAVYIKMLMIGFFENIASERGIAERCSDSISIRFFLGYDLTQSTPDHSTLSVIRSRLGEETYQKVFLLILCALQEHGLVKGQNVGIDASVIEANAALKSLVNRDTEEAYWEYVRRLASESGVDPKDSEAVRQFDRKRAKKMSNDDWQNPYDPDAKIGPTKAGAIDMIYKPEHTVDLDTGAILQAEVRLGHEADQKDLALHVLQAQENINHAQDLPTGSLTVQSATADKLRLSRSPWTPPLAPPPCQAKSLDAGNLRQDVGVPLQELGRSAVKSFCEQSSGGVGDNCQTSRILDMRGPSSGGRGDPTQN